MSNVIDFLERMGQDARLRGASLNELEISLRQAQLDPEISASILTGDQRLLESLLGASNVCCALMPGRRDQEEEQQQEQEQEDHSEETPSREDQEASSLDPSRVAVAAG